jgi:murein L,D-transpeptidase YcbB/YkuD
MGVCGTDVKVLAALLVKHGYLAESDIETDTQGYTVCNAAMVTAIKKFQTDANLEVDGYAGPLTIKALKNWEKR